jgi:F-type H+-transporting ATPase subunit gamma
MMFEELSDVDRASSRLTAIASVRQVVHGLWAVARAQAPEADRVVAESETYLERVWRVVERLSEPTGEPPTSEHILHVVFGPERGFCGPLARKMADRIPPGGPVAIVGTWMAEFASETPGLADRVVFRITGPASPDEIGSVSSELTAELASRAAHYDIRLHFPVARGRSPRALMLLESRRTVGTGLPETWSSPEAVLEAALTEWLAGQLAAALSETFRTEVHARMTAADKARKNCDNHMEELERTLRILRQEQITSELLDLVGGQLIDDT